MGGGWLQASCSPDLTSLTGDKSAEEPELLVCAPFKCHLPFFGLGDHPQPNCHHLLCDLDKVPPFLWASGCSQGSQGSLLRGWRRELILNPPIPPTGSCPFPALGCVKGWFEVLWPRTFEGLGAFGLSDPAELLQVRLWRVRAEPQGGFLLGCPIPYPHHRTRRESETVRAGDKALGWVLPCGDQTVSSQPHLDSCVSSQSNFQPQRTPCPPPERLAQVR